ncbi:hypothetical protein GQF61_16270 [Sphingobacterium sp. DK4209]|uniref:Uncharacterized protein n=1 Tax=Sphingobacterium zhuxiongii TaxID=2662364 RepID=A0A5Q0Q5P6_9SPHI|nr:MULTISPECIES: hypothetical protein [unclassified Sphingobacterium]MVZ67411.1 hypothetical protein [Sphingobacterium sp. DK4209]QGA25395.1 hypothetical protein GFH32_03240 [Sphingobacterium sp. dk4302]
MAAPIKKEIIKKLMEMHFDGVSKKVIATTLSVHLETVKRVVRRELKRASDGVLTKQETYEQIANDRLTMSLSEVSAKYKIGKRQISEVTKDHPLRPRFFKPKPIRRPKEHNKEAKKPKLKPKPTKKKKDVVVIDQSVMQKGHVKLQKNEKILPNRVHKPKKSVPMFDSKNTVLFVDIDDLRNPEEIRSEWRIKQELSLKNLAV